MNFMHAPARPHALTLPLALFAPLFFAGRHRVRARLQGRRRVPGGLCVQHAQHGRGGRVPERQIVLGAGRQHVPDRRVRVRQRDHVPQVSARSLQQHAQLRVGGAEDGTFLSCFFILFAP